MPEFLERGRQSGRTRDALASLPDGAIYLVHDMKFADYCRGLLRSLGRNPNAISFATPSNFRRYEGARISALGVDHAYWMLASGRKHEARDFLVVCVL